MWKGLSIADKFSGFFSLYSKMVNTKLLTPTVEHNDDGQIIIHLNQLIPMGKDSFNFSFPILLGLINSCYHNKLWKITPAQFMNIREDMQERLPGLMCDIGGLFAHEVDLVLGTDQTPAAYRLDHRFKGSTGLMKHTETFSVAYTEQPPKSAEQGNESMNDKVEKPKRLVVVINEFLSGSLVNGNPNVAQAFQNHMLNGTGDFFVDQMDALQACHAVAPSLAMLLSLAQNFTVELTVWSRCEPHHPGWDFKCTKRYTGPSAYETKLGDHDGDRGPISGVFGASSCNYGGGFGGYFGQPVNGFNMGMNDPNVQFGNDVICELLNLYGLVQLKPLPAMPRGRYFPAGLELLELVKQRLLFLPQTIMPHLFNNGVQNMGMSSNGPGYAGMGAWMDHAFMDQPYTGAVGGHPRNQNYPTRFTRAKHEMQNFDITPPQVQPGDVLKTEVVDRRTNQVLHIAANRTNQTWAIYVCTQRGNLLQRVMYLVGEDWTQFPGLADSLQIPTNIPSSTFEFTVCDKIEDTIVAVNEGLKALSLSPGVYQAISSQVCDVLKYKPVSASDFFKLQFTMGIPELMPEGLEAAIHDELNPSKANARGCWIIHTGFPQDPTEMPIRFWVLQDNTPRQSMY